MASVLARIAVVAEWLGLSAASTVNAKEVIVTKTRLLSEHYNIFYYKYKRLCTYISYLRFTGLAPKRCHSKHFECLSKYSAVKYSEMSSDKKVWSFCPT